MGAALLHASTARGADRGARELPLKTIISTGDLQAHLGDGWVIVDCRYDLGNDGWGREQYLASHIPGALYASLKQDLAERPNGSNGRHPLPSVDALAATMSRLGVSRDGQVVVYDQDSGMYASRLWWSLKYLGHDQVAVLDGGWAKWAREARPTASGEEHRTPTTFVAQPREHMCVRLDDIGRLDTSSPVRLIDARAPERFEGRVEPIDRVPGHIPGAVNHYYRSNVTGDGTMLPPATLRAAFERTLDGHDPARAITYCGSGVTACHNVLAMEHAGLPGARLYPGSWSEWSSDPARPVEKGPSRA